MFLTIIYRSFNIFCTFSLRRNNKCEWFVEVNEALLQYVAINCCYWSPVTTNKINGPLGKNVVLHHQFIIILPLYSLNNKNTPVAWFRRGSQSVLNVFGMNVLLFRSKHNLEVSSVLNSFHNSSRLVCLYFLSALVVASYTIKRHIIVYGSDLIVPGAGVETVNLYYRARSALLCQGNDHGITP